MKKLFLLLAVALSCFTANALEASFAIVDYYGTLDNNTDLTPDQLTMKLDDNFTIVFTDGSQACRYRTSNGGRVRVYPGGTFTVEAAAGVTITGATFKNPNGNTPVPVETMTVEDGGAKATFAPEIEFYVGAMDITYDLAPAAQTLQENFAIADYYGDLANNTDLTADQLTKKLNDNFTIVFTDGSQACRYRTSNGGRVRVYPGGTFTVEAAAGVTITGATFKNPNGNTPVPVETMTIEDGGAKATFAPGIEFYVGSIDIEYTVAAPESEYEKTYAMVDYYASVGNNNVVPEDMMTIALDADLTISFTNGSTPCKYRETNGGRVRVYPGGTFTLTAADGVTIKSATFVNPNGNTPAPVETMTVEDGGAKAVFAPEVEFYVGSLTVVYTKAGAAVEQCAVPVFSVTERDIAFNTPVEVTCETEGATLHYIFQGEQEQTAELPCVLRIRKAMTITAWTSKEGFMDSKKVTQTYVVDSPKNYEFNLSNFVPAEGTITNPINLADGFMLSFAPEATAQDGCAVIPVGGTATLNVTDGILLSSVSFYDADTQQNVEMEVSEDLTSATISCAAGAKMQRLSIVYHGGAKYESVAHEIPASDFAAAADNSESPWSIQVEGFEFTFDKAEGVSQFTYNANNGDMRVYANNTLTIRSLSGRPMTDIQFAISKQGLRRLGTLVPSSGLMADWTGEGNYSWAGTTNVVTFTVPDKANLGTDGDTKAAQLCFTGITIYTTEVSTSVENVALDANNAQPVFYNLQGQRVANPANGVFIMRQGDKATKVKL